MKAKIIVDDGREIEIEISEEELLNLKPQRKTGYERVEYCGDYYYSNSYGDAVISEGDVRCRGNNAYYNSANYYSDKTVAANNARADQLMRKLRRFAVEHRTTPLNWRSGSQNKYSIYFDYGMQSILVEMNNSSRAFGAIYFDSDNTARLAINTFREELVWYFMEYKDSL